MLPRHPDSDPNPIIDPELLEALRKGLHEVIAAGDTPFRIVVIEEGN